MASAATNVTPIKDQPTGLALLRVPFPDHQISKLPKPTKAQTDAVKADFKAGVRCDICGSWHHPKVVHLDYVGHAALTDRLLDVDPAWAWEPLASDADGLPAFDRNGGLWIKLTVLGGTRLGLGNAASKPNQDPGNREKEVIGDALRNAGMRFGMALDLWHKGSLHLDEGEAETPVVSADEPHTGEPAPNYKGWREPESQFSTPTKLHAGLNLLDRELEGCGDSDMVYAVIALEDWKEFVRVAEKHSPHYLRGGDPAPPEFVGLLDKAERRVAEFDTATANHITDIARA